MNLDVLFQIVLTVLVGSIGMRYMSSAITGTVPMSGLVMFAAAVLCVGEIEDADELY